jgi:Spy/CpxP family protein refolding chaperone
MKTRIIVALLTLSSALWGQTWETPAPAAPAPVPGKAPKGAMVYHRELGKWWQSSDIVKKLQLGDGQVAQLDQIFYEHRLKLIDFGADMEKQDLKLQMLVDADVPNEGQVEAQVDQVLAARGKLEREFTMMNLELRKVLSIEQWRQLKAIRGDSGGFGDRIFFRKALPPGAAPVTVPLPPGMAPGMPAPPPPPMGPDELL